MWKENGNTGKFRRLSLYSQWAYTAVVQMRFWSCLKTAVVLSSILTSLIVDSCHYILVSMKNVVLTSLIRAFCKSIVQCQWRKHAEVHLLFLLIFKWWTDQIDVCDKWLLDFSTIKPVLECQLVCTTAEMACHIMLPKFQKRCCHLFHPPCTCGIFQCSLRVFACAFKLKPWFSSFIVPGSNTKGNVFTLRLFGRILPSLLNVCFHKTISSDSEHH